MKKVVTIAGSDCSGGAGIQADIKTITAHHLYAMSAITALTAQNTTGVYGVQEAEPTFLQKQLQCIFEDIYPDAIKVGMVSNADLIEIIAVELKKYQGKNIVVDPVMVSTSGSRLLEEDALNTLKEQLLPLADVITPNIPEAEILSGISIQSAEDMVIAGKALSKMYKGAILVKGGHALQDANDLLYVDGKAEWFYGERIDNPNTHGTGCTLSSAIACNLAKGYSVQKSIENAKKYLSNALRMQLDLGKGSGPLNHMVEIG